VVPWKLRGTLRRDKKLLLGVHAQNGKSLERRRWGAVEEETNHVEVFAVPSRFKTSEFFFFFFSPPRDSEHDGLQGQSRRMACQVLERV